MRKVLVLAAIVALLSLVDSKESDTELVHKELDARRTRGSANLFQAHAIADARKGGGKGGSGGKGGGGKGGTRDKSSSSSKGGTRGKGGGSESGKKGRNSGDKGRMFYDDDEFISGSKSKKGDDDDDDFVRDTDDDDGSSSPTGAPIQGPQPTVPQPTVPQPTVPQPSAPQPAPVNPAPTVPQPSAPQPAPVNPAPTVPATGAPVVATLTPVAQSPAAQRCTPTVGPCVDTFASMTSILASLENGNTVAICSESTIRTTSAASIEADETTLCCAGVNCVVSSDGNTDRNLLVTGNTFTVTDIIFEGGSSDVSGGNVAIFGSGNHHILDSRFQGGNSRLRGGNLFISTEGNVLVDGSTFADGTAAIGGGGLAIESAVGVEILSSQFVANDAPEGGGLFSTRASATLTGQMILIEDSSFVLNTGEVGGGFLVSNLGELPSLTVLNTEFTENSVDTVGGAAAVVEFLTNLNFKYNSNTGSDNTAIQFCNGILTAPDASAPECLVVTDNFP